MDSPVEPAQSDSSLASVVLLACSGVFALGFGLAGDRPWLCGVAAIILLSLFLMVRGPSSCDSASDDEDDDGGGGSGPPRPPAPPTGGIPLPDASQSHRRLRDHDRERSTSTSPRRAGRRRTPTPVR